MIPVLPFIGVLIVSPFSEIKNIRIKFLFIFLILVIGFITFLKELNSREFLGTITLSLKINETEVINLIDLIKNSSIEKKAYGIVFPLELPTTFKYYAKLKDFELETGGTYYWLNKSLYPNILGIDYLLVTENEKFWGPITAKEAFREILIMLKNKSHEINSYFKLVGEYSLTDELKIKLYKNFKVIPLSKSEMEAFL
jgi:hypothetical protein